MTKNVSNELVKLLKNKSILFIEGDMALYNTVGILEDFLVENSIKYSTILMAGKMSMDGILSLINFNDVIIWESQYVTKTSHNIMDALFNDSVTRKGKMLIECYVHEPHIWYKPGNLSKRVIGFTANSNDTSEWELYEFGDDGKAIWNKSEDEL